MTDDRPEDRPDHPDPDDRPSRALLARRVVGFDEALQKRMATSTERLPFGSVRVTPDLPLVYSLSGMHIDRPVALSELRAAVDRWMGDLPNQSVWTTRAEVAWSLGGAMTEDGWTLSRVVFMVHDRTTEPTVSPLGFRTVDAEDYAVFTRPFVLEEEWGSPPVAEQMVRRDARLQARMDARFVLAPDDDAGCHVYRHGTTAQVEAVGVLTESRGRGLGAGLMAAAMRECADAETVFLIADADGWPKDWYARLGFGKVATGWEWNRKRDAADATAEG